MNKYFEAYCRHWISRGWKVEIIATHDEYVFIKETREGSTKTIFSELFKDKNPEYSERPEAWFIRCIDGNNELTIKYNVDWREDEDE